LECLGEQQIVLDCDVIQADGGTRTAAVTGSYVALSDAVDYMLANELITEPPLIGQCAAVSAGVVDGDVRLDLCYAEDAAADVDFNLVMRSDGTIIELQGSAEGQAFPRAVLDRILDLAESGIQTLFEMQKKALNCD
jgi:ribonuclease PH